MRLLLKSNFLTKSVGRTPRTFDRFGTVSIDIYRDAQSALYALSNTIKMTKFD